MSDPVVYPVADMQSAEPLLYDELVRRRESLHPDSQKQIYDLHTSAIEGNVESIFRLSEHYYSGSEVLQDYYLAFRLVRFVAERGHQPAFFTLGQLYVYGMGTQRNHEEAVRWFLQTDYSQDVDVLPFLAGCYYKGIGVPKDETKAYDYWIDAALLGHSDGFRFCEAAAETGYARGQFYLGHFYQHGFGTPPDIHTALHLFHLAAEQNYVHAQCRLGILYSEGEFGIEKDPAVAVQWFRLAADQNDTEARRRLADCLIYGKGVEQNLDEAVQILTKLAHASSDYPKGEPISQYHLGALLTDNNFTVYNPKEGLKWLRKAAEQNVPEALGGLGIFYYGHEDFDDIVKQDFKEARFWIRRGAKLGNCVAQYYLGEIYFDGNGVPADRKEAFKWYKQSADIGYIPAQQKVAYCYLNGIGTPKNESDGYITLAGLALLGDEEALTLLRSAAASGNPAAEFGQGAQQNAMFTPSAFHLRDQFWTERETLIGKVVDFEFFPGGNVGRMGRIFRLREDIEPLGVRGLGL